MNILFNLTAAAPKESIQGGSGLYGESVFFALLDKTRNIIGIYDSKRCINKKILESGIKLYDINLISIRKIIEKENIKIFYTPLYNSECQQCVKINRFVVTWHDIRALEVSTTERFLYCPTGLKGEIKRILLLLPFIRKIHNRKYKKIGMTLHDELAHLDNAEYITVSEHSKYTIKSYYPHLAQKEIPVLYAPQNIDDNIIELPPPKFESKTYFLLMSCDNFVKNNLRAALAFDELFSQRKDLNFKVVLTSVTNEKVFTRKLKNRDKFILLNHIDRANLLSLQKNAYAFICPSLNEGFGYLPIECMRYGVPVAASGISAIPEICQNAAIYFDPYSIKEIKNRILQLLDKKIYAEYSARAVERYKIVSERQKQDLEKIVHFILGENNDKKDLSQNSSTFL